MTDRAREKWGEIMRIERYKCLLFDINGTLIDYWGARDKALKSIVQLVLNNHGINYNNKQLVRHVEHIREIEFELKSNGYSLDDVRVKRFEGWINEIVIDNNREENYYKQLNDTYTKLTDDFICIYSDVKPVLDSLVDAGYCLGVISNGPSTNQIRRLRQAGIEKYFSYLFFSQDIGIGKPNKEFYDHVFNNIEYSKDECIAIGDDIKDDVAGALGYGMDVALLSRLSNTIQDRGYTTVRSLIELCRYLGIELKVFATSAPSIT